MARLLSQAAQAAKEIRHILKAKGIPARVKSENFSMGSSVDVYIQDQPPQIRQQLEKELDCYEYGTFDAMTDCSGVKNRDFNGPQAKYLHITNDHSDEMQQKAWELIRKRCNGADEFPAILKDAPQYREVYGEYIPTLVHQVLTGYREELSREFWADHLREITENPSQEAPRETFD